MRVRLVTDLLIDGDRIFSMFSVRMSTRRFIQVSIRLSHGCIS